jgi:hypothetical protein
MTRGHKLSNYSYCYCLQGGISQGVPYLATITDLFVLPHLSSDHSLFIHQCCLVAAETSNSEAGELSDKCPRILRTKYLFHTVWILTSHKKLQHGTDSFTSPLREVILWIISLKNPLSSRV